MELDQALDAVEKAIKYAFKKGYDEAKKDINIKLKEAYTDGFNDSKYDFDTENYEN